jgi:hypothetical protein
MSDEPNTSESDTPLNPALKSTRETVYDTRRRTPAPFDSASAKEGEGEAWPWVWLIVTLVCVVIAIYLIV